MINESQEKILFNYKTLRLTIGVLAFLTPILVALVAGNKDLPSISAGYHSKAHDLFVGLLFIIGILLFAYNGNSLKEALWAKVAAGCAIVIALFPTECVKQKVCIIDMVNLNRETEVIIHGAAAFVFFSILAYFCFGPFRKSAIDKSEKKSLSDIEKTKAKKRKCIYTWCGIFILLSMLLVIIEKLLALKIWFPNFSHFHGQTVFIAEFAGLWAFGFAWLVASHLIKYLANEEDKWT